MMRLVVLLLLAASPAFAQFQETDRTVDVQIRAGAYLPDIDSTFPAAACKASGQCPYEAVFQNDDPLMLMLGAERHLLVDVGTLSVGGAIGYWNVAGKTLIGPGVRGNDSTELSVVPMMLQATYKLDVIQDIIPVVPVLRVGVDYYYWRVLDGEGEVASFEPGCSDPAVLSRLDSLPPAALIEAPQTRREAVVKNPETLKKLNI